MLDAVHPFKVRSRDEQNRHQPCLKALTDFRVKLSNQSSELTHSGDNLLVLKEKF